MPNVVVVTSAVQRLIAAVTSIGRLASSTI
jgi:hypothetical protein